jgi:hypothetical protein
LPVACAFLTGRGAFVLVYLRKGETYPGLAAGFGVGTATAWRYVEETTALLAGRAPKLRKAVRDAKRAGHAYVIVDGTLIPVDRVAADRPFYSGKHKRHGMNLQVIAARTAASCGSPARCPARCTTRRPSGSGTCWPNWRPRAWSSWPTRATRDRNTRRSRTRARTSRNPRKPPTAPTRHSARPANAQTPSSRTGTSSGVKNQDYPDTLYVSGLIAPDTVNTMPEKTLKAYADHGRPGTPIQASYDEAAQVMKAVADAGVDLDDVFAVLEDEGIQKFTDSWDELTESVRSELEDKK